MVIYHFNNFKQISMKKNTFEWEIITPITPTKTKIKGYLFLFMIVSSVFISLVGQGYKATKVSAPNPAKEYPQDNWQTIDMNNLPGKQIKNMDTEELRLFLQEQGFRRLQNKSLVELRRIWLGFMYEDFFYTMHKKTDLPISVIYAFFIIEATNAGIESKLMAKALNPGGIKYRGTGKKINAMDDCYKNGKKIPCAFQAFSSYNAMVEGWADVLNLPRYKNCKRFVFSKYNRGMSPKEIVDATCKCFYKSGYHTSNLWKVRSNLSTEYWTVKASFPEMEY
jgi:hypothetical protein